MMMSLSSLEIREKKTKSAKCCPTSAKPPLMAAPFLSPTPSFHRTPSPRINQVCPSFHSDLLQKGIITLTVQFQSKKCNIKLYMVPSGAMSRRMVFKRFATAESLLVGDTDQGNQPSSDINGSNMSQRSNMLLAMRRKPLDDDLEVTLQELFVEIKKMVRTGKKNDARDLLQANYEAVKEQMDAGSRGVEEAAILDVIALGYMAVGDPKMVDSLLNMLNEVVSSLSNDEPILESVLIHMGSMYSALGKFEKSMLLYQRVLEIMEREYGNSSSFLVTPLLGMGKVLSSVGRATKAVNMYQRAITILESNRGPDSDALVIPLFALGKLLLKERKAADAENTFMRIVNIYTKLYGEDDDRVGMAMCSLANAKCAKGDVDEAIQLYRNALQVLKHSKTMSLDDSIIEKIRIDLAELLHVVGRVDEGRELLEECLSITETCRGKGDRSSVTHLVNLATSYSRTKNFVEAERLLRNSVQILTKSVGPNDPSITFPMLQLAITLYNLKHDEEAEKLAVKVLRIREKAFGRTSLPVGEALDCLASIQSRLERDDSNLLKMHKRILRIQEREFGSESVEVIETLKKIVYYLDKMGMKNEKAPVERRLFFLLDKYSENSPY